MKKVILSIGLMLTAFVGFSQTIEPVVTTTNELEHAVTIELKDVLELRARGEDGIKDVAFVFETAANYEDGMTENNFNRFELLSTKDWKVQVNTDAAAFTNSNSENESTMPASVLSVRVAGGEYFALSEIAADLTSGTKGGFAANRFAVSYRANPGFDYEADTYSINVVFTASAE